MIWKVGALVSVTLTGGFETGIDAVMTVGPHGYRLARQAMGAGCVSADRPAVFHVQVLTSVAISRFVLTWLRSLGKEAIIAAGSRGAT